MAWKSQPFQKPHLNAVLNLIAKFCPRASELFPGPIFRTRPDPTRQGLDPTRPDFRSQLSDPTRPDPRSAWPDPTRPVTRLLPLPVGCWHNSHEFKRLTDIVSWHMNGDLPTTYDQYLAHCNMNIKQKNVDLISKKPHFWIIYGVVSGTNFLQSQTAIENG